MGRRRGQEGEEIIVCCVEGGLCIYVTQLGIIFLGAGSNNKGGTLSVRLVMVYVHRDETLVVDIEVPLAW